VIWAVDEEEIDSYLETNKIVSEQKGKMMPQKLGASQTTDGVQQIDPLQIVESSNSINELDVLASLQKMKIEEQALIEQKLQLVETEQNLHGKLIKEIEKKKITIANLISEINDIQNRTKQLGEALGIDIYNKTQVPKINTPIIIDTKVQQDLRECVGLLNCPKPEKCGSYDSCLKKYMTSEMRNEVLKF
jgi:hypothetical protein